MKNNSRLKFLFFKRQTISIKELHANGAVAQRGVCLVTGFVCLLFGHHLLAHKLLTNRHWPGIG